MKNRQLQLISTTAFVGAFFHHLSLAIAEMPVPSHSPGHSFEIFGIIIVGFVSVAISVVVIAKLKKKEEENE